MYHLWEHIFRALIVLIFMPNFAFTEASVNRRNRNLLIPGVPQYAYSISHLQGLERFEFGIVKDLSEAIVCTEPTRVSLNIRNLIHLYLRDFFDSNGYQDTRDALGKDEIRASKNPICAYRLVRRVALLLRDLVSRTDFLRFFGSLHRRVVHHFLKNGWAHFQDAESLAEKILRIQNVYDLDAKKLARGWISSTQTNCTLNSIHSHEIGKFALKTEQFASAIEWLELAKEQALVDKKSSISLIDFTLWNSIEIVCLLPKTFPILRFRHLFHTTVQCILQHNDEFDEDSKLELPPLFFDRKLSHVPQDWKSTAKLRNVQRDAFQGSKDKAHAITNYWELCSGANFQTEKDKSRLFCWYEFKIHPSFEIGPIKMEFLARDPDILQIFEVFSSAEIETLKYDCDHPVQQELEVVSYQLAPYMMGVSKTTYHKTVAFNDCKPSRMRDLDKKLERMTGLNIKDGASENFMFTSYSVGGHLAPHFDHVVFQSKYHYHYSLTLTKERFLMSKNFRTLTWFRV